MRKNYFTLAVFISLYPLSTSVLANDLEPTVLEDTCVLSQDSNGVSYSCETNEFHLGNSTAPLDFTTLVINEHYPSVIQCDWLGDGTVKGNQNSGGGYVLSGGGSNFNLYKESEASAPNIIGISFEAVSIQGVKIQCMPL